MNDLWWYPHSVVHADPINDFYTNNRKTTKIHKIQVWSSGVADKWMHTAHAH